jgi:hypothetical protein
VRLLAAVTLTALAVLAAGAGSATAADECRGLMVCISVPGPWVVAAPDAEYVLDCPRRRSVVAGVDVRLSVRGIDVSFLGAPGSPVSPGVTTTRYATFLARYIGKLPRAAVSFRPFLGCVPLSGGGGRGTTAVPAEIRPEQAPERRLKNVTLRPGALQRATQGCNAGERLVGSWHAVAFRLERAPTPAEMAAVKVTRSMRNGTVTAEVRTSELLPFASRAEVQVGAVCTR